MPEARSQRPEETECCALLNKTTFPNSLASGSWHLIHNIRFRRFLRRDFPWDFAAGEGGRGSAIASMAISAVCREIVQRVSPRFRLWISPSRR